MDLSCCQIISAGRPSASASSGLLSTLASLMSALTRATPHFLSMSSHLPSHFIFSPYLFPMRALNLLKTLKPSLILFFQSPLFNNFFPQGYGTALFLFPLFILFRTFMLQFIYCACMRIHHALSCSIISFTFIHV